MLNATELAGMRSTMGDSLAGTAIIQTQTRVSDGGGGGTTTWAAAGTFDCRVAPATSMTGGERFGGDRLQPETEVIFTVPNTVTFDADARISYEGRIYTVTALRAPRTWEISRRVEAKEVE